MTDIYCPICEKMSEFIERVKTDTFYQKGSCLPVEFKTVQSICSKCNKPRTNELIDNDILKLLNETMSIRRLGKIIESNNYFIVVEWFSSQEKQYLNTFLFDRSRHELSIGTWIEAVLLVDEQFNVVYIGSWKETQPIKEMTEQEAKDWRNSLPTCEHLPNSNIDWTS